MALNRPDGALGLCSDVDDLLIIDIGMRMHIETRSWVDTVTLDVIRVPHPYVFE